MARKPGKPIRRKRTTQAKRASNAGGEARHARAIAEPIAAEESESDLVPETGASEEAADDAPIEVSEFRPIESPDDEAPLQSDQEPAEVEAGAGKDGQPVCDRKTFSRTIGITGSLQCGPTRPRSRTR